MTTDAQAIRHLWTHKTQDHPFLSDQELVIDRGEGVWIWTEQGKKLLDGYWERVAEKGKDDSPYRAAFDYHCKLDMPADPIQPAARADCIF